MKKPRTLMHWLDMRERGNGCEEWFSSFSLDSRQWDGNRSETGSWEWWVQYVTCGLWDTVSSVRAEASERGLWLSSRMDAFRIQTTIGGIGEHYSIKGMCGECAARKGEGGTLGNTDFLESAKKDAIAGSLQDGPQCCIHTLAWSFLMLDQHWSVRQGQTW